MAAVPPFDDKIQELDAIDKQFAENPDTVTPEGKQYRDNLAKEIQQETETPEPNEFQTRRGVDRCL